MIIAPIIIKTQKDIIQLLKASGLQQGEGAEYSSSNTYFWNIVVKGTEASKASKYLVWNIVSAEPSMHADNIVLARQSLVEILLYSRTPIHNKEVSEIITSINNTMINNLWTFEMVSPPAYDVDNQMYIYSFDATHEYYD